MSNLSETNVLVMEESEITKINQTTGDNRNENPKNAHSFVSKYEKLLSPVLYFFSFFLLDLVFRLSFSAAGSTLPLDFVPTLFTTGWSLIFTVSAMILPGKMKKAVMIALNLFFVILSLVQAVVYGVSESFISFSDFAFVGDGAAFMSWKYFALPWQVYLVCVLSVFLSVSAALLAPKIKWNRKSGIISGALLLCGTLLVLVPHLSLSESEWQEFQWKDTYDPFSKDSYYTDFFSPNECLMLCGSYHYTLRSAWLELFRNVSITATIEELDGYYAINSCTREENEMTGIFEGKNAICVLLESIDTWMVTPDIMPTLYSLMQESIQFENHFTPLFLSAGTFNTEYAFNCGFYLPATGTGAKTYATGAYPQTIAKLFSNAGYTANSFHQLDGCFYNRNVLHPKWGYAKFYDRFALGIEHAYSSDEFLMQVAYPYMVSDDPFFSYVISYTAHGPYTALSPDDKDYDRAHLAAENSGAPKWNGDIDAQFVTAISKAMKTDDMVTELVNRLNEDGHIEDTVLVFFGDHWCKYMTDKYFVMELKGVEDDNMLCQTPFFIYSASLEEPKYVTKVTSSVDMMPTIANLFGLAYDPTYLIGNDAFGDGGGYVAFSDYSWYDGEIYYHSDYEGEITSELREMNQKAFEMLNASWNTVITNYLSKFDS